VAEGTGAGKNEVHTMAMYAKVRRMRLRDGLSITEIAREILGQRQCVWNVGKALPRNWAAVRV
jgi:hypothetical protein